MTSINPKLKDVVKYAYQDTYNHVAHFVCPVCGKAIPLRADSSSYKHLASHTPNSQPMAKRLEGMSK